MIKGLPAMQEPRVQSRGLEDLLEKEMATHSSVHEEEPGKSQSMGSQGVGHDGATNISHMGCI